MLSNYFDLFVEFPAVVIQSLTSCISVTKRLQTVVLYSKLGLFLMYYPTLKYDESIVLTTKQKSKAPAILVIFYIFSCVLKHIQKFAILYLLMGTRTNQHYQNLLQTDQNTPKYFKTYLAFILRFTSFQYLWTSSTPTCPFKRLSNCL